MSISMALQALADCLWLNGQTAPGQFVCVECTSVFVFVLLTALERPVRRSVQKLPACV